jgi:hypothetical protein
MMPSGGFGAGNNDMDDDEEDKSEGQNWFTGGERRCIFPILSRTSSQAQCLNSFFFVTMFRQ